MKAQTYNEWDREDRVHPKNLKAIRKIQLPTIKHRKQMYESLISSDDDFDDNIYTESGEIYEYK